MSFAGRSVLVTGAARGIGQALAVSLAEQGAQAAARGVGEARAFAVGFDVRAAYGVTKLPLRGRSVACTSCAATEDFS